MYYDEPAIKKLEAIRVELTDYIMYGMVNDLQYTMKQLIDVEVVVQKILFYKVRKLIKLVKYGIPYLLL